MVVNLPWKGSKINIKFRQRRLVIGSFNPKISALAFKSCQSSLSAYKCQHTQYLHPADQSVFCLFLTFFLSVQWACWLFFLQLCFVWLKWQKPADPRTALHKPLARFSLICLYARWMRTLISTESNLSTSPQLCRRSKNLCGLILFSRGWCCDEEKSLQQSKHQE